MNVDIVDKNIRKMAFSIAKTDPKLAAYGLLVQYRQLWLKAVKRK